MTLALFVLGITLLTLYGLTVSGHFPFELRSKRLQTPIGTIVIGVTLLLAAVAAFIVLVIALDVLPWTAIVLAGGAALLAGPLLLRVFPDEFVDGTAGMVTFALAAITIALILWATY
jgi:uncharacterized membrane protein